MWQFFSGLLYILGACSIGYLSLLSSEAVEVRVRYGQSWLTRLPKLRSLPFPLTFLDLLSAYLTGIFTVKLKDNYQVSRASAAFSILAGPLGAIIITTIGVLLYKYIFTHIPLIGLYVEAAIRAGTIWSIVAFIPLPGTPVFAAIAFLYSPQWYYRQLKWRNTVSCIAILLWFLDPYLPFSILGGIHFIADVLFTILYIMS